MENSPLLGICGLGLQLLERRGGWIRLLPQYRGDVVLPHPPEKYDLSQIVQVHLRFCGTYRVIRSPRLAEELLFFVSLYPSKSKLM